MSSATSKNAEIEPFFWSSAQAHLRRVEPRFSPWIDASHTRTPRPRPTVFEALCRSVLGQQISTHAANAIVSRLQARCAGFSPIQVQKAGLAGLRDTGLSRRKSEYVLGLAAQAGQLEAVPWVNLSDDEVRSRLITLRGIGPWTADMFLIFQLLRPDVLPLGDGGIQRAMRQLFGGAELSNSQLIDLARPWRPYRSVASWYLWRSLDGPP